MAQSETKLSIISSTSKFLLHCVGCWRVLMEFPEHPQTNQVLRIIADNTALGHTNAYSGKHSVEIADIQNSTSTPYPEKPPLQ